MSAEVNKFAPREENRHIGIGNVLIADGWFYRVTFNQQSGLWGQRRRIGDVAWGRGTCKVPADFIHTGHFSIQKGARYAYPDRPDDV